MDIDGIESACLDFHKQFLLRLYLALAGNWQARELKGGWVAIGEGPGADVIGGHLGRIWRIEGMSCIASVVRMSDMFIRLIIERGAGTAQLLPRGEPVTYKGMFWALAVREGFAMWLGMFFPPTGFLFSSRCLRTTSLSAYQYSRGRKSCLDLSVLLWSWRYIARRSIPRMLPLTTPPLLPPHLRPRHTLDTASEMTIVQADPGPAPLLSIL